MPEQTLLKVENLSVELEGLTIIKGVSFELKKEEVLAIVGPNGAGKSVLLKTLLGFFPYCRKKSSGRPARPAVISSALPY